jgi:hypothetical protein
MCEAAGMIQPLWRGGGLGTDVTLVEQALGISF